ncbi:MAG: hypothetical protein GOU97_02115 [Nanoarchaeota archaeon]|nr:hypothetical protein [Nanoarchaeota archaeon]
MKLGIDTLVKDFLDSVYPKYCKLSGFVKPDRLVLKIKQNLGQGSLEEMQEKGLNGSLDEFVDICGGCAYLHNECWGARYTQKTE